MNALKRTSLVAGLILVASTAFAQSASSDTSATGSMPGMTGSSATGTASGGSMMNETTSGSPATGTMMSNDADGKMNAEGHADMKKHKSEGKMEKRSHHPKMNGKHATDSTMAAPGMNDNAGTSGTTAPMSTTAPAQNPNNPHAKPVPGGLNNQQYNGGK